VHARRNLPTVRRNWWLRLLCWGWRDIRFVSVYQTKGVTFQKIKIVTLTIVRISILTAIFDDYHESRNYISA
jgi:hypothetical protein